MDFRSLYLGVSMAASWAWGASIIVGLTILSTVGVVPWLVWAVITALSPGLFYLAHYRMPQIHNLIRYRSVRGAMSIVQLFAIWIQMQIVYEASMLSGYFSDTAATVFALLIGAVFVAIVLRGGLKTSMNTDQIQWYALLAVVVGMVFVNLNRGGDPAFGGLVSGWSEWGWIAFVIPTQLAATWVDMQMWQRARIGYAERRPMVGVYASGMDLLYRFLMLAAFFQGLATEAALLLLVGALMVATSTLDSAAAALQEITGRNIYGVAFALVVVALWPLVTILGVVGLWGTYVGLSVLPALAILVWGLYGRSRKAEADRIERDRLATERDRGIGEDFDPEIEGVARGVYQKA